MKTMRLIVGLVAFGCLFFACEEEWSVKTEKQGCITGRITFFNTESVIDAYVQLLSKDKNEIVYSALINNSSGRYTIDNIAPASYRFRVFKLGFIDTIFSDIIKIKSKASNDDDCLQMDWTITKTPSRLSVVDAEGNSLDTLDYGGSDDDVSRSFTIFNNDSRTLNWKIEKNASWISSISKENGILKPGETQSIVVSINRKKLNVGENKTTMHVLAENCIKPLTVIAIGRQYTIPVVKVLPITDLETHAARLHAVVLKKGDPEYIERGFVYGTYSMLTLNNKLAQRVSLIPTEDSLFQTTIERNPYSRYYIRAYAITSFDTVYSANEETFYGSPVKAEVRTLTVLDKSIRGRYLTVSARIIKEGNPKYTECGFVYDIKTQPTIDDSDKKHVTNPINGDYSATLDNLELDKEYYVRAYVIQEGAADYGIEIKEKLSTIEPKIQTSVKDKTDDLTTLYAEITGKGEPEYTEVGFLYGTYPYPTIENGTGIKVPAIEIGDSKYMAELVGLNEGETYYACAYVHNNYHPIYGNIVKFKVENRYWKSFPEMGIMVQRKDLGQYTFNEAMQRCNESQVGGFSGWRLPNVEELKFLHKNSSYIDGFSSLYFHYWSSEMCNEEEIEEDEKQYKALDSGTYSEYDDCRYETEKHYVRAVRTIPIKK